MNKIKILLKKIYWKVCKIIGFSIILRDERASVHSKKLKLYKTITGSYYLPQFAHQDVIKKEIIKNRVFDFEVFKTSSRCFGLFI